MAVQHSWPLQRAIYARLTDALSVAGIDGAPVPVFDHIPTDAPRLHVRIDGMGVLAAGQNNDDTSRHLFEIHVFDVNSGSETGAGVEQVVRLQTIVVGALQNWVPIDGATAIQHIGSNPAADDDPLTQHRVSRFSTMIGD